MRVRDDDGGEPAEGVNPLRGRGVEERDAVPEDVADGRGDQDAALPDAELGDGGDGGEASV